MLVPQSVLCNPGLYKRGSALEGCQERAAWILPRENTLYLVPQGPKKMQGLLDYWVAMTSCICGTVANCTDAIQKKLGE
ncbi:MAG: hypothetical protein GY811_05180 [Myxococcales bacterium]|nr:hypothetical protein [Myxococcales bacterium]